MRPSRRLVALGLALLALGALWGCGGSSQATTGSHTSSDTVPELGEGVEERSELAEEANEEGEEEDEALRGNEGEQAQEEGGSEGEAPSSAEREAQGLVSRES